GLGCPSKSISQLVKLDLVGVLLRRVRARMTHQRLQSNNVATALPEETIGEAMPKLVRGEGANASPLADAPHHPHQRLPARRNLRVGHTTGSLVLRHPLLDLDGEQMIVKLWLQLLEARP